jgi:propane monooxygenase reductase subunit
MAETHSVRLEPVGIEFEVNEDETVLNGAFRQGLMLMHGCKEGQCGACKSFLLDGEVDLDRYSTFALPDYELDEGWTLLCRAHAVTDLEVELINYDEDELRNGVAIREVETTVVALEPLTRDIYRLELQVAGGELPFRPGQYVDIEIPGTDLTRSFSMANLPNETGRLEFMIKHYPGGRFSALLSDGGLSVGDALKVKGPYGMFALKESEDRPLLFIGGGAGMAPILSLLRSLAERGEPREAVYYYGARTPADLFHLEELAELCSRVPGLRFVPALSDPDAASGWTGEAGLITDVVTRLEAELGAVEAYLCGPPPMVDAAIGLLNSSGLAESSIHFDKFTTTVETEESSRT